MHESITRACSTRAAGAPITPRDLWPTRCPKCIALLPFLRRRRPPFATRHPDPIAAGGGCCTPQSAFEQRTRTPAVASRCKRSMPQRGEARRCSPGERRPRLGASFEGADVGGVNCVVAFHVVSAALSMPSIFSSTSRAGPATPSQGMTGQSSGPVVDARRPRAALVARCPRPSRPPTRPARGRSRPSTSTPGGRRRDEGTNGQSRRSRRLSDRHRSRSRRRAGRRSRWRRYRARLCTFMEALLHACLACHRSTRAIGMCPNAGGLDAWPKVTAIARRPQVVGRLVHVVVGLPSCSDRAPAPGPARAPKPG